jgi:hypothetical protein
MTGKPLDPEEVIRAWLAESVPNRAPASLKDTLDDATSEPAGHARPWSRSGGNRFRLAGRIAAAVAIIAIAASGAYLYESGRASSPDQGTVSPSGSPTAAASATSTTGASPSPANTPPQARVTQLPGSNWRLVSGALPRMTADGGNWLPLFALPSGGFVALTGNSGDVRVFKSADGISWDELAHLPAPLGATVSDVTESHGTIVAVGSVGGKPAMDAAVAWTTTDGQTWQSAPLSPADGSSAYKVAAGPGGFLASGTGPKGVQFWASTNGVDWHSVAQSGLPADPAVVDLPGLFGTADGYVLAQAFEPRVWQSSDGIRWTETYRAPTLSGISTYFMGSILRAPNGSYRSFGGIYTGTGIGVTGPVDRLIWTSPDMTHWTKSVGVRDPGLIYGFAAAAGGFVAAGTQAGPTALEPLGVWTSGDGRTWKPLTGLASLPDTQVVAVAGDGSHVVIAAVDGSGNLLLLVGDGLQ